MALDVPLLRRSFALVLERNSNPTHRFYEILFSRYPAVRPLFGRHSQERQERMLAEALSSVIDHLDDAPWLDEQLCALGARHREYGVTDEMYDWVGDALLATLAEISAPDWSAEHEAAWAAAFGAIARRMQGAPS